MNRSCLSLEEYFGYATDPKSEGGRGRKLRSEQDLPYMCGEMMAAIDTELCQMAASYIYDMLLGEWARMIIRHGNLIPLEWDRWDY